MELFRELLHSLKSDKCLGIGLWGSSKPLLSLLVASRLLVFTVIIVVGQLVFKVTMELVVGFEIEWITLPQSLLYLQRIRFLSCVRNQHIPPVLIFGMLTKLISTILDSVLTIFMEERFSGVLTLPFGSAYCKSIIELFTIIFSTAQTAVWRREVHGSKQNWENQTGSVCISTAERHGVVCTWGWQGDGTEKILRHLEGTVAITW